MNKEISIKQYVLIDITILSVILCALEIASKVALNAFPRELFSFSVVLAVTSIAMMRHGSIGVIVSIVGAIVYSAVNGASFSVYVIYILGNACVAASLLWFKALEKEKIQTNKILCVLYVLTGYIAMNLGRGIFATVIGSVPFIATTIRYFTTDALSGIMAAIAVLVASNQNGVFEDQLIYLNRLAAEKEQSNAK